MNNTNKAFFDEDASVPSEEITNAADTASDLRTIRSATNAEQPDALAEIQKLREELATVRPKTKALPPFLAEKYSVDEQGKLVPLPAHRNAIAFEVECILKEGRKNALGICADGQTTVADRDTVEAGAIVESLGHYRGIFEALRGVDNNNRMATQFRTRLEDNVAWNFAMAAECGVEMTNWAARDSIQGRDTRTDNGKYATKQQWFEVGSQSGYILWECYQQDFGAEYPFTETMLVNRILFDKTAKDQAYFNKGATPAKPVDITSIDPAVARAMR